MATQKAKMAYYEKAFGNMRRCLKEAETESHPYATRITPLKNPTTSQMENVMSVESAIKWCVNYHTQHWASSTWRMIRAGYKLLLAKGLERGTITQETAEPLIELMYSVQCKPKSERVKKTSSKRKKTIKESDIIDVEQHISSGNFKWGDALLVWLRAAVITGLRPNEWSKSTLKEAEGKSVLRAPNFKHNKERSYATHREIELTNLGEDAILAVKDQMNVIGLMKEKGMLSEHYTGCRSLLLALNKILWPRRNANITLYTGRHQFSANAKASEDCNDLQRAALMGHKTTKTSRERYGRTGNGNHGLTPEVADPSVLSKIKNDPATPMAQKHKKGMHRSD
jgi:integrase